MKRNPGIFLNTGNSGSISGVVSEKEEFCYKGQARVEISLSGLCRNAVRLREYAGNYYCVLKCDAYGHGAVRCAEALYFAGFDRYAVYSLSEALEIKPYLPGCEILILGRTPAEFAEDIVNNGFVQSVFSEEYALELSEYLGRMRTHIKLDSGMNRTGFKCRPEEIYRVFSRCGASPEGVYTHFHGADATELSETENNLSDFIFKSNALETMFGKKLFRHAAASAASLRFKEARLDACRIGIALYGGIPDNCRETVTGLKLEPVMSFYGSVIDTRKVKKGENIGYGCDNNAKNDMYIATVSAGYANGLLRCVAKTSRPLVDGFAVNFAGRICMDRCMLDITEAIESGIRVKPYDEVEFFGRNNPVNLMSDSEGTIVYETLTRVGRANKNKMWIKD